MLPLVALLLLKWNDPQDLVRDLSSESIEVRERATSDLYRRGEDVRGVLLDALAEASELEPRARIQEILRRLDADGRIRDFGGANRVGGFAASLRTDRFYGSGPFRLYVDIMNLGPGDRTLPGIGTWELELPDQEVKATGSEARVALKKFIGTTGFRRTTWRSGDRSAGAPKELRPGDCARFEYVLDARSVPAGDYQISVEYFARTLIPDAEENLRTNSVHLMIRK